MISYLKGKVLFKGFNFAVIEANGIGFKVFVSPKNLDFLMTDQEAELYCYFALRQDAMELYGFLSREELDLFELLTSVSGVGPKAALKITSLGSLEEFEQAIEKNDHSFFRQVKGIGAKTIQKVILELSGKIKEFQNFAKDAKSLNIQDRQILETLKSLGFRQSEALDAISAIPPEITEIQEKIRFALKSFYSKKQ
ncbi:MAG TPA: Holliday junction branch migration protein RuvA [Candidatus Pacearchaeota archaeon]|nr:Holliday junction branch migration protein RuvA [Candidatus Pacearchaeota archaeon]HPM08323.1 Holliday junction branch migration protein RuvA [Candidatus Pacearchaeota archaeon]HQI74800.1 Holliday junction branch migration protein RuvA [Candidatus Pacearchaeota archaeon]